MVQAGHESDPAEPSPERCKQAPKCTALPAPLRTPGDVPAANAARTTPSLPKPSTAPAALPPLSLQSWLRAPRPPRSPYLQAAAPARPGAPAAAGGAEPPPVGVRCPRGGGDSRGPGAGAGLSFPRRAGLCSVGPATHGAKRLRDFTSAPQGALSPRELPRPP